MLQCCEQQQQEPLMAQVVSHTTGKVLFTLVISSTNLSPAAFLTTSCCYFYHYVHYLKLMHHILKRTIDHDHCSAFCSCFAVKAFEWFAGVASNFVSSTINAYPDFNQNRSEGPMRLCHLSLIRQMKMKN